MTKFSDYSPKSLLEKVGILFVFMSIMHIMHKKSECQSISHPRSLIPQGDLYHAPWVQSSWVKKRSVESPCHVKR